MSSKKKKVVEINENVGLVEKLRSLAPTGAGAGTWEVASTKDLVLSAVNYVLTTGIDAFDDVVGGMPVGRMVELYGLESCGKTAMSIRCAARAQNKQISEIIRNADGTLTYKPLSPEECKTVVVYIDNEQSLDEDGKLDVGGQWREGGGHLGFDGAVGVPAQGQSDGEIGAGQVGNIFDA